MRIFLPRTLCLVFAAAWLSACSRDPQRAAFDEAAAREQGGRTEEVVAAYERAAAWLSACSRDPQRAAFDEAAAREQGGRTEEVVAAYERAAAMNPSSELGLRASHKAAELRTQAAQQEEAHKAVFQEHGVD